jgi:hypothetical protein
MLPTGAMRAPEQWRAVIGAALVFAMASVGSASAAGWAMHEFESPLGDKGTALRVTAKRRPGVHLAIACDGDTGARWRGIAVVEDPDSSVKLGMRGDVVIRLGTITSRDVWSVRTTTDERRVFTAPEATKLARRLLRAEAADPAAEVTIDIHGVEGKPVPLTFPLAGLGAKVGTIAVKCADWELQEQE